MVRVFAALLICVLALLSTKTVAFAEANLTLVVAVINNDGGTGLPSDFSMSYSGPVSGSASTGMTLFVPAGTYTVNSTIAPGYRIDDVSCAGGTTAISLTSPYATVTLVDGDNVSCMLTFADNPPGLALEKTSSSPTFSVPGEQLSYSYKVTNTGAAVVSAAITVSDDRTTVNCPALPGGGLAAGESITCTATDTVSDDDYLAGYVTNTASASSGAVSSNQDSVTVNRADNAVADVTQRVIKNFVARRSDQIVNSGPDLAWRLLDRGQVSGANPLNGSAAGTEDNLEIGFAAGVSTSAIHSGSAGTLAIEEANVVSVAAHESEPDWGLWTKGRFAHVRNDSADSDLAILHVGMDYRVDPSLVVGLLGQFDYADETDTALGAEASGWGWLIGPYAVKKLGDNLVFDARAAYGGSRNEVSPFGTYTDDFDTKRWLVSAAFTGDFRSDSWIFNPAVKVTYMEETQGAYTDSQSNVIAGQRVSLGRLTFGPRLTHETMSPDGSRIAPHIEVNGLWDFDRADVQAIPGTTAHPALRARAEAGITIDRGNGLSLDASGFYDGIGTPDFDAYGGSLKLSIPLN